MGSGSRVAVLFRRSHRSPSPQAFCQKYNHRHRRGRPTRVHPHPQLLPQLKPPVLALGVISRPVDGCHPPPCADPRSRPCSRSCSCSLAHRSSPASPRPPRSSAPAISALSGDHARGLTSCLHSVYASCPASQVLRPCLLCRSPRLHSRCPERARRPGLLAPRLHPRPTHPTRLRLPLPLHRPAPPLHLRFRLRASPQRPRRPSPPRPGLGPPPRRRRCPHGTRRPCPRATPRQPLRAARFRRLGACARRTVLRLRPMRVRLLRPRHPRLRHPKPSTRPTRLRHRHPPLTRLPHPSRPLPRPPPRPRPHPHRSPPSLSRSPRSPSRPHFRHPPSPSPRPPSLFRSPSPRSRPRAPPRPPAHVLLILLVAPAPGRGARPRRARRTRPRSRSHPPCSRRRRLQDQARCQARNPARDQPRRQAPRRRHPHRECLLCARACGASDLSSAFFCIPLLLLLLSPPIRPLVPFVVRRLPPASLRFVLAPTFLPLLLFRTPAPPFFLHSPLRTFHGGTVSILFSPRSRRRVHVHIPCAPFLYLVSPLCFLLFFLLFCGISASTLSVSPSSSSPSPVPSSTSATPSPSTSTSHAVPPSSSSGASSTSSSRPAQRSSSSPSPFPPPSSSAVSPSSSHLSSASVSRPGSSSGSWSAPRSSSGPTSAQSSVSASRSASYSRSVPVPSTDASRSTAGRGPASSTYEVPSSSSYGVSSSRTRLGSSVASPSVSLSAVSPSVFSSSVIVSTPAGSSRSGSDTMSRSVVTSHSAAGVASSSGLGAASSRSASTSVVPTASFSASSSLSGRPTSGMLSSPVLSSSPVPPSSSFLSSFASASYSVSSVISFSYVSLSAFSPTIIASSLTVSPHSSFSSSHLSLASARASSDTASSAHTSGSDPSSVTLSYHDSSSSDPPSSHTSASLYPSDPPSSTVGRSASYTATSPSATYAPPTPSSDPTYVPSTSSSSPWPYQSRTESGSTRPPSSSPTLSPSPSYTSAYSLPATSSGSDLPPPASSSSSARMVVSTVYTTVVYTSTYTSGSHSGVWTWTTVVTTGTLIPEAAADTHGNIFAHNGGALAGLVIGCIAFVAVIGVWSFLGLRRYRVRRMEAEAAAGTLGTQANYGSTGRPGRRGPILADDDDDEEPGMIPSPQGGMAEHFGVPVSLAGAGGAYGRLRGGNAETGESPDGAAAVVGDPASQEEVGARGSRSSDGAVGAVPMSREGSNEHDALIHSGNSSSADMLAFPPAAAQVGPRSPARSRRSSCFGPDPAAWLGGRDVEYAVLADDPFKDPVSPTLPPSVHRYSSDELTQVGLGGGSGSEDMEHMLLAGARASGSSSQGHGGYASGPGSVNGHAGPGSSSGHGHEGAGGSSNGHGWLGDGRRSPGPSSLLPTQQAVPPTSFRTPGDPDEERTGKGAGTRRRSFLGRPLPWRKGNRMFHGSTSSLGSYTEGVRSLYVQVSDASPPASNQVLSPASSFYDPARLATDPTSAPTSARVSQGNPFTRSPSIIRPQSPVLGSLPASAFQQYGVVPEISVSSPSGQRWPGLSTSFGPPDLPSPALTEVSSQNAPEGLLDPRLGQLGPLGMQSQGAISFRDDMDYSRPIHGLVNNRQHSTTTFQTVDTQDSLDAPRRTSTDSRPSMTR
ncbi:hypothetical protein AcV7_003680 [Taiwanofungus camphoratus]|nr:hypothetical protein AcV7_003680 [Antrodia cinnamomea]